MLSLGGRKGAFSKIQNDLVTTDDVIQYRNRHGNDARDIQWREGNKQIHKTICYETLRSRRIRRSGT